MDTISSVDLQTQVSHKDECPKTFASFEIEWYKGEFGVTAITPEFPLTDKNYQNACSFIPDTMKNAFVFGIIIGNSGKTNLLTKKTSKCWFRQWKAVVVPGYHKQLMNANRTIVKLNNNFGPVFSDMAADVNISLPLY